MLSEILQNDGAMLGSVLCVILTAVRPFPCSTEQPVRTLHHSSTLSFSPLTSVEIRIALVSDTFSVPQVCTLSLTFTIIKMP